MSLSRIYKNMEERDQEQEDVQKVASYYDRLGADFFQKTAGSNVKGGFLGLVKKIMGKIKAGKITGRKMIRSKMNRK